jgi:uncharacterized protein (UPF0332 family)
MCQQTLLYGFYSVSALLEKHGFASSKHSGVKSLLNWHFIKPEKISKAHGKLYNLLFDMRQEGDYVDFVSFDAESIEPLFPKVEDFIATVSSLISGKD